MQKKFAQTLQLLLLSIALSFGCGGIDPINVPDAQNDGFNESAAPNGSDTADVSTDTDETGTDTGAGTDSGEADPDVNTEDAGDGATGLADVIRARKIFHAADRTLIVGVENAISGGDAILVRDPDTDNTVASSQIALTGAFTAQTESGLPDVVSLTVNASQEAIGSATLELCDGGVNVYEFSTLLTELWTNESLALSRSGNLVEMTVPAATLPRGLKVVVGNLDNDHGSITPVSQDGSLSLTISADSGQDLAIFAVEGNCNGGGEPLIIEAP